MSDREGYWPMALGFALLAGVLLVFIFCQSTSAQEGWHEAANSNNITGPIVWPATNVPPRVDLFTWVCFDASSNLSAGVTNCVNTTGSVWRCCYQTATNTYAGYGLYAQLTNCVFSNYFAVLTNYYDAESNRLVSMACTNISGSYNKSFVPTNASFSTFPNTNWIGTPNGGKTPTNRCGVCITNALGPFSCLTNLNADGGVVATNQTWQRVILLSDSDIEKFRWSYLRGAISNWQTIDIASFNSGGIYRAQQFPLWWPTVPVGTSTTNYFKTDSALTNQWRLLGTGNTQRWQYAYAPMSNVALNVQWLRQLDAYFGLTERLQVMANPILFNVWNWFLLSELGPGFGQSTPFNTDAGSYRTLLTAKNTILQIAPNFVIKELADANGDFDAYLAQPITNWSFIGGNFPSDWFPDVFYPEFPIWGERVWDNAVQTLLYGAALVETQMIDLLNLPGAYLTVIETNTAGYFGAEGWRGGNVHAFISFNTNMVFTNRVLYGSFFDFSPKKLSTLSAGFPGLGHLVSNRWDFTGIWTEETDASVMVTNPLTTAANTLIVIPRFLEFDYGDETFLDTRNAFGCGDAMTQYDWSWIPAVAAYSYTGGVDANARWEDQVAFSVLRSISNCITTNGVSILTNVCAVNFKLYLRGESFSNTVNYDTGCISNTLLSRTDSLVLETNLTSATSLIVSNVVMTNYNIAPGWHEIDYGWQNVRKCIDSLTLQAPDLEPHTTNYTEPGRWSIANAGMGVLAVANLDWSNPGCASNGLASVLSRDPPGGFALYQALTNYCGGTNVTLVNNLWPSGVRVDTTAPTINQYLVDQLTVVTVGISTSPCVNSTTHSYSTQAYWSDCPPSSWSCGPLYRTCVFVSNEATTVSASYTFLGSYIAQSGSVASAYCGTVPTNQGDSVSSQIRASSSLLYPESCTNFTSKKTLYVRTAPVESRPSDPQGRFTGVIGSPIQLFAPSGALNPNRLVRPIYSAVATNIESIFSGTLSPLTCGCTNLGVPTHSGPTAYRWKSGFLNDGTRWSSFGTNTTSVTNFNVILHDTVPTWNGGDLGLQFDDVWGKGRWQKISFYSTDPTNSIRFDDLIGSNTVTTTGDNPEGWNIDAAKVLIKWDADPTNGFRFHE